MRKFFSLLIGIMLLGSFGFASDIKVFFNSNEIKLSGKAVMESGRVLVPMRSIFEAIGATVNWDQANNLITSVKDNTKVALQIGNKNMGLNGKLIAIDVAPKIESGRTIVPVRVISESFGYKVNWNDEENVVYISSGNITTSPVVVPTPQNKVEKEVIESFNWVYPEVVLSYYEITNGDKVFKTTTWNEPINKEVTINSNRISFIQCIDEIDFRDKVFTGHGWSRLLPHGTKVTLIRIGKMYPDTLYVRLADGTQGVIYQSNY